MEGALLRKGCPGCLGESACPPGAFLLLSFLPWGAAGGEAASGAHGPVSLAELGPSQEGSGGTAAATIPG